MFIELKQRQWWIRKHITLLDDGIHYVSRDHDSQADLKIDYSSVSAREKGFEKTEYYNRIQQVSWFLAAIGIIRSAIMNPETSQFLLGVGMSLLLGVLGWGVYRLVRTDYLCVMLDDNTALYLLKNKPNEKAVREFIDQLFAKRKAFYREKYFYIDYEGERKSELSRMEWLRAEDIISENEYLVVVDEINENL